MALKLKRKKRRIRTARVVAVAFVCLVLLIAIGLGGCAVMQQLMQPSADPSSSDPSSSPSSVLPPVSSEVPDPTVRPVSSVTVLNTGDILVHQPLLTHSKQSDGSYLFDPMFAYVSSYIQQADYATINLELSLPGSDFKGYPRFRTPDSIIDTLMNAGFDMSTTANNHSNDSGETGFLRTMQVLQQKGMDFIGTRPTEQDKNYLIKQIGDIKVGMINYTYGYYTDSGLKSLNAIPCTQVTSPLVNMFSPNNLDDFYTEMQQSLAAMKQDGAEVIVAYMHWGNEYRLTATQTQKEMAQALCDMGVDIIVGSHPHVVEPLDVLTSSVSGKSTLCVYSMGNSISNQRTYEMDGISAGEKGYTEDGMLFSYTLTKYTDGSVRVTAADVLPTWVHLYKEGSKKIYQMIPLDTSVQDWSVFGLNNSSDGLKNAQKSYDRTMAIVQDGLNKFAAFFADQQQQLDDYNAALLAGSAA